MPPSLSPRSPFQHPLAGVPQLAQLLSSLHNSGSRGLDQAAALFLVEGSVLMAVQVLLQRKAAAAEGQYWVPK